MNPSLKFARMAVIVKAAALTSCGSLPSEQPVLSESEKRELLRIHNEARAKVGAPPLVWSNNMERASASWAKKLARKDRMIHKTGDLKTENLAYGTHMNATKATQLWLDEKKHYKGGPIDAGDPHFHTYGHYTQMIWSSSREVGYGIARNGRNTYVVANYYPAGNIVGLDPVP